MCISKLSESVLTILYLCSVVVGAGHLNGRSAEEEPHMPPPAPSPPYSSSCVSMFTIVTQLVLVAGFPAGVQLAPGASPRLRNSFLSPAPWLRASEGAAAERGMNRAELSDSFRLFWRG